MPANPSPAAAEKTTPAVSLATTPAVSLAAFAMLAFLTVRAHGCPGARWPGAVLRAAVALVVAGLASAAASLAAFFAAWPMGGVSSPQGVPVFRPWARALIAVAATAAWLAAALGLTRC